MWSLTINKLLELHETDMSNRGILDTARPHMHLKNKRPSERNYVLQPLRVDILTCPIPIKFNIKLLHNHLGGFK